MSRTRSRTSGVIVGGKKVSATTVIQGNWDRSTQTTTDEVDSPGVPHGFSSERVIYDPTPLNGHRTNGYYYENWIPVTHVVAPGHLTVPGTPTLATATNNLMTRSNPGRAEVNLPRAIAELRDIPHMIRQGGDLLRRFLRSRRTPSDIARYLTGLQSARDGGGIYLGYEFGVAPIISDLKKCLEFESRVSRRMQELRRLYGKGGLRRRLTLFEGSKQDDTTVTIASELSVLVDARRSTITRKKLWGTIRWKPTNPTPGYARNFEGDARYRYLARRAVFGLGAPQLGDAWDIIPWTWLGDWFADVGGYLHTFNNRIPSQPGTMCIMTTTATSRTFTPSTFPLIGQEGGQGTILRTLKERSVRTSGSLPTANLPFLNGGQLSILGALAVTRGRR